MIALALRDTLRSLDLSYPDGDPLLSSLKVE
jgi:hypothetical protein